jgi:hypothetical protein
MFMEEIRDKWVDLKSIDVEQPLNEDGPVIAWAGNRKTYFMENV